MITRDDCVMAVKNVSQFKGANVWVPYFWDALLAGDGTLLEYDEWGNSFTVFEIQDADRDVFPELLLYEYVSIQTNVHGLIYGNAYRTYQF